MRSLLLKCAKHKHLLHTRILLLVGVWLLPMGVYAQYPAANVGASYRIMNRRTGMALEIGGEAGYTIQAGRTANQWPYQKHGNQEWSITTYGSGDQEYVTISNRNSTQSLEVPLNSSPGAQVVQNPCNNTIQQRWRITNVGGGTTAFPIVLLGWPWR
jgi:hypothetical protein